MLYIFFYYKAVQLSSFTHVLLVLFQPCTVLHMHMMVPQIYNQHKLSNLNIT